MPRSNRQLSASNPPAGSSRPTHAKREFVFFRNDHLLNGFANVLMASLNKRHIPGLDGIRAIAVALVYVEHKILHSFTLGALGVNIFFCLSGFLIIGILHSQRLKIETGNASFQNEFKTFWIKRIRRIFPVYYATVAGLLMLAVHRGKSVFDDGLVPWYVFLSPNLYIGLVSRQWTDFTHLWSIGVEQHFYMLISPLLLFVSAVHHKRALVILFVMSMAAMWIQYLIGEHQRSIYVSSLGNFFFMAGGGLLALQAGGRGRGSHADLTISLFATLGLIVIVKTHLRDFLDDAMLRVLFSTLGVVIGITLLRHIISRPDGIVVRVLEWQPIRYLGAISYGFYVYHALVPLMPRPFQGMSGEVAAVLLHLFACLALSAASWHVFEKRFLLQPAVAP